MAQEDALNPQRILLPINTRKCYLEVFHAANGFARQTGGATAFLLHVVHLNIPAPGNAVYEQLGREAHWHLRGQLARRCLPPGVASIVHVPTSQGGGDYWLTPGMQHRSDCLATSRSGILRGVEAGSGKPLGKVDLQAPGTGQVALRQKLIVGGHDGNLYEVRQP